MYRASVLGLLIWLGSFAGSWLVAQPSEDSTFEMDFPSDPQRQHVVGTVMRRDGKWRAYTFAIRVEESSRPMRRGLFHFTSADFSHREWLRRGTEQRFRPYNELMEFTFQVLEVDQGHLRAKVTIPGEMPGAWRVLSGPPPALPPGVLDFNRVRGEEGIEGPRALKSRIPSYPQAARDASVNGKVILGFILDEEGHPKPESIHVARGVGYGLEEAAIEALLNDWKLAPARRNGQPVPMWINVEFDFNIR
ncbi:MAG TPA: energy transducer TonB [Acidobacteriota bacterium]|nr:energy transducer TonB [Acidobacteriota bacterium]